MKKCKENYIKILTAMCDNSNDVAEVFENSGNTKAAEKERAEAGAFQIAIWLLTDFDNSFEKYGKIYFPEEFEE